MPPETPFLEFLRKLPEAEASIRNYKIPNAVESEDKNKK